MFCKNCGKELPDGAKFCNACGAAVDAGPEDPPGEPNAAVPEQEPAPISSAVEGSPAAEAPGAQAAAPADGAPNGAKGLGKKGIAILGAGAAAIVLAAVLLFNLIGGMLGGGKSAYVYLTDEYELMYLPDLKEKTEALEIDGEAGRYPNVQFSPDGKTIYYINAESTLYQVRASDLKKDESPDRVAKDVQMFTVLKDGRVLVHENSGGCSVYDGDESFRLAKAYVDYRISEDGQTFYYTEYNGSDGTTTLYRIGMTEDAKREKLVDGASIIFTPYDAETLVYSVVRENKAAGDSASGAPAGGGVTGALNNVDVYACKPGEKGEKLVDGAHEVYSVSADGEAVSVYYFVQAMEERTLYEFVNDPDAAEDARLAEEEMPAYPNLGDYYFWDFSYDWNDSKQNYEYCYINARGDRITLDFSEVFAELDWWEYPDPDMGIEILISSYVSAGKAMDIVEADIEARCNRAMEEYDEAYERWAAASNREHLREALKSETYSRATYDLYRSGTGDPIAREVSWDTLKGSAKYGVFLYKRQEGFRDEKLIDMADLEDTWQVLELLDSGNESDGGWYQNVGGVESASDLSEDAGLSGMVVLGGREALLSVYEDGETTLESYAIGDGALASTGTVADGEFCIMGAKEDTLYLFTDMEDADGGWKGDFQTYRDGKLELVAEEVFSVFVLEEGGETYVVTEWNGDAGELAQLKDGELCDITDEFSRQMMPVFLGGGQALYLSGGDLYHWNGKEENRVARDVAAIWASGREAVSYYQPYQPWA